MKNTDFNVVGVSGYGYSGSGAVVDLLKEYGECSLLGDGLEFAFLYYPNCYNDLKNSLIFSDARFMSSDVSIGQFESSMKSYIKVSGWQKQSSQDLLVFVDDFVKKVSTISWEGYWLYDEAYLSKKPFKYFLFRLKRKAFRIWKINKPLFDRRMLYSDIDEETYVNYACHSVSEIMTSCVKNKKTEILVVNQLVPANNPIVYLRYIPKAKVVIVDKDPRDSYILASTVAEQSSHWIPKKDVKSFIDYYKALRKHRDFDNSQILYLHFEDLVYNYEQSVSRIENFLGIRNHFMPKKFFNPDDSICNTQLYKRYEGFENQISIIEKELKDFLYDFSPYESLSIDGDPFDK